MQARTIVAVCYNPPRYPTSERRMKMYRRNIVDTLIARMNEPRRFIQVLLGPRQTGKSTAIRQALREIDLPYHFAEVESQTEKTDWIRAQWQQGRNIIGPDRPSALLVIDEVQYVKGWADAVKALWDEDARAGIDLRVVLTGSSATLLKSGMGDSLTGRFELIRCPHWYYSEMKEAFGYTFEDFLFFGGYPGAAGLREDLRRWVSYVTDAIIEPTITKDILALEEVRNPALLRRLFYLGAPYSAQEISYRKLLGQLDDRGNTATIAHYLTLLSGAGMLTGLQKYDSKLLRERSSSPRLCVQNTALMAAAYGAGRERLLTDPDLRGRLVESAVGAYLISRGAEEGFEVFWWRDGNKEVDFVIESGADTIGIEVKSGRVKSTGGLTAFVNANPHAGTFIVGSAACPVERFLSGEADLF